jgi:hypothetical protein
MRGVVQWIASSFVLVLVVVSCRRGPGGHCSKQSDCDRGLFCDYDRCSTCAESSLCSGAAQCKPSGHIAAYEDPFHACAATAESCASHREVCEVKGKCHESAGACVPFLDDCARSKNCKAHGACSIVNGDCGAARDEDCASSEDCKTQRRCKAKSGACVE